MPGDSGSNMRIGMIFGNASRSGRGDSGDSRIEAAHGAVLRGGRFRRVFDRYTDGGKRNRHRGYILVGQELCRTAYAISKKKTEYRDDPPERPGSSKRRAASQRRNRRRRGRSQKSRPGTGQPEAAMVEVG